MSIGLKFLFEELHEDVHDLVSEAIDHVLEQAESLCLDNQEDKDILSNALKLAMEDVVMENGLDESVNYVGIVTDEEGRDEGH